MQNWYGIGKYTNLDVSDDGSTVLFLTARPLQTGDSNGLPDVYEWHQGEVSLISGGQSTQTAPLGSFALTPSGSDVFFESDQPLVAQDTDGLLDVYDARIDGGLPAPSTPPAPCAGDACQGYAAGAPAPPVAASVTFSGPGDAVPGAPVAKPKVLTRAVRGASFMVSVRAPGKGRVAISGPSIRTVRRTVARAGTYRLRVTLTANARTMVSTGHTVRVKLRVAYTTVGGGAAAATITLAVHPMPQARHAGKARRRAAKTTRRAGK